MRRSPRSVVKATGLVLLCGALLLGARRAPACGNAVSIEEERVDKVMAAEKWLRTGRAKESAQLLIQHFPTLKTIEPKDKLILRARRILALAVVRTDGLLPVPAFAATTSEDRRKNLEWAVQAMRESDADAPGLPIVRANLAEALATLPEHQQEAFDILDGLARRDVLPTTQGYHTLAHLRALVGDDEGARAALQKHASLAKAPPPFESFPQPARHTYRPFAGPMGFDPRGRP
jgi:predicted Zn-dependent protease